jgi:hypothetical protein
MEEVFRPQSGRLAESKDILGSYSVVIEGSKRWAARLQAKLLEPPAAASRVMLPAK